MLCVTLTGTSKDVYYETETASTADTVCNDCVFKYAIEHKRLCANIHTNRFGISVFKFCFRNTLSAQVVHVYKKRGKLESGMQSLEGSSDSISTVTHKNRQLGVVIFSLGLGQGKIFIFFQCGSGGKKYARNRGVFFFFFSNPE